jgi:glycosyltransferase involved in cell wall biosynthesis
MVPDGGIGLYYFIFHYMAALLLSEKIILHHRTSKYVENHMVLMSLISRLGRGRVCHVFLSENMAVEFQHKYGPVYYMVCTNAYFVDEALSAPITNDNLKCLKIGHLSNLCKDKGFFLVADLFERLMDKKKDIKLFLAGPIIEKSVQQRIDEMKRRFPSQIIYHGPIYAKKKTLFYQGLDLFVFPSRYSQEAQPNVIYEALAAGVPVISTSRGCIPEMLYGEQGFVSPDENNFVDFALNCIENKMTWDPQTRQLRRHAIRTHMRKRCNASKRQYAALLSLLIGNKDENCFT